jgi:FtsH-binding integral membrane protein
VHFGVILPNYGQVRALSVQQLTRRQDMATRERRYGPAGGLTLGGIIVVVGIVLMFVWSFWLGLIIALVGLIFFGGFARGRWY